MKKYIKPTSRVAYLGTEEDILDTVLGTSKVVKDAERDSGGAVIRGEGYEDLSKGNSWDSWE